MMIRPSKGVRSCRGWRARSKTGSLTLKCGRTASKIIQNSGGRQWFHRPIRVAPLLVSDQDFRRGTAGGWASSTCGACMTSAAGWRLNGKGKEREIERERERKKERQLRGRMGKERGFTSHWPRWPF